MLHNELYSLLRAKYKMDDGQKYAVHVMNCNDSIQVEFEITFRRDTWSGAYSKYRSLVNKGNQTLNEIASEYKSCVKRVELCTADSCKGGSYSEHEQSICGFIVLDTSNLV